MGRITIAGGHGQVALLLSEVLAARGDTAVGLIRSPDQTEDLRDHGAVPSVLDLEAATVDELSAAIAGSDAVVFAAGAGPGSGAARKETVDYGAAVKLRQAAEAAGVDRYVMVSAMGTDDPPDGDDDFAVYLRAKARADEDLASSGLAWTIVRPGRLTDDPPTGEVTAARHVERGSVPRADVAAVLASVLAEENTIGRVFELVAGETTIKSALADLDAATRELSD
jgi:uncharacterized protein YbjT (DUF2867 family)